MTEAQALERLRLILARPEFQPQPGPFWERWFTAVRDWLADRLLDLLGLLRGAPALDIRNLNAVQVVALIIALMAVAGVVFFVARGVGLAVSRDARLRAATSARVRARSDQLWQEGQALAQSGRFAEGCRALYLSALYALEEHGLVRVEVAQTNREHAERAVRAEPGLARSSHLPDGVAAKARSALPGTRNADLGETFSSLVQRYDRLRYGHYEVDRTGFDEISALVGRTRSARPSLIPKTGA